MTLEQQAQSLLIATRKLLTPEERWGQGHYYMDYIDEQPTRYCLGGALLHCAGGRLIADYGPTKSALLRLEQRIAPFVHLHYWNDEPDRTHAQVLKLLDDTIGQEGK